MADAVDMLTRFLTSTKPRPKQAQQIPGLQTDFFDVNGQFQPGGFRIGETSSSPTQFDNDALQYYNTEVKKIVIPTNFQPTDQGINLNRWTPDNQYSVPGAVGLPGSTIIPK